MLQFFLNPVFLLATGTAAVPVVIHLIHRRQAPRIAFSTLRFLRLSVERTARRRRIEDLLLLVLRALLFFLLALALAKPFIRGGGAFGATAGTSIAIVLDNSASMGLVERGERWFGRAKEMARSLLAEQLRSGRDACCLIFTNGPEALVEPALETNLQRVDTRLSEGNVSVGFADLARALERAADVLAASQHPNRELYVVTDLQAASWRGMTPDSPLRGRADLPLVVVDVGSADFENLAVTDLAIEGQGLVVEVPVTIRATLFNGSDRPVARFVSLYLNRARVDTTPDPVPVPAQGANAVAFTHTFHAPGQYAGWVRVDHDSLDLDNQRHFVVTIARRLPVLLVKEEQAPVAYQDEAFFVTAALNPYSLLDAAQPWAIDPKTEAPERLTPAILDEYPVVYLLNCRAPTPALAQALGDFVRAGGGLVIGAGDRVDPAAYARVFAGVQGTEGGLLPAVPLEVLGDARGADEPRHPRQADLTHELLAPFVRFPSLYQTIIVRRYLKVATPLPRWAHPILSLDNGDPLILERAVGAGRVVLVTTTLTDAWTSMPASHFFAPLLQRLTFYLSRAGPQRRASYTAGAEVRVPFPGVSAPTVLDVTTPNDETLQVKTTAREGRQEAAFALTFEPGVYAYQSPEHPQVRGAFAVNADPAEAALARADWEALRRRIPLHRAACVRDLAALRERVVALRRGVQLWNLFLFAVLLLAVFECFAANRVRPPAAEDPSAD